MTKPEKRQPPYIVYVDRDMGACTEDSLGRLHAVFGFHPDGKPAVDEAEEVASALNYCHAMKVTFSVPEPKQMEFRPEQPELEL